ncbi:hypothetical protein [Spirillospora sp. NPDC047279]|uniref:hypothetical protein n=1 Tax=Spirillospora sp. NPDC047279 TaxID=3155478 RepID=UPI0033F5BD0B
MREIYVHDRGVEVPDVTLRADEHEIALQIGNLRLVGALATDGARDIRSSRATLRQVERAAGQACKALDVLLHRLESERPAP